MFNRFDRGRHLTPEQKEEMLDRRREKIMAENEAKHNLEEDSDEKEGKE
ncbi:MULTISPECIES: hypothetical protein [Pontibacillus]|uniref:Uncharacterized protein n=1 Tax=Pontibacillus chungwhensis TaxID=265426 RepID=A0ABY8UWJ2_9BACI|nr:MULTISPECIES: hypothetical protein [Pontibacillus]MCD5325300.1 hypothetical protein [Pontibacillus sp. HN14]WIF97543.1 hypothetical protein QNI29_17695 [Pontibacillus chungwhensis]